MKITALIKRFTIICLIVLFASNINTSIANNKEQISFKETPGYFELFNQNTLTPIVMDQSDYDGVAKVAKWFVNDLKMITGQQAEQYTDKLPENKNIILIGTIGRSKWIDQLIAENKINISQIKGQWEANISQVVENPFPNISKALVLAGSDKRGTIYSMLNLSREMGVSPWYWWADVPVVQHQSIFINPAPTISYSPKVKYRGIFLNDEEPALGSWTREKFGGFNHHFYENIFELILRLRGNFLWPAMWGKAFFDDDPKTVDWQTN